MTCDHCGTRPEFKVIKNDGEKMCFACFLKYYPEAARVATEYLTEFYMEKEGTLSFCKNMEYLESFYLVKGVK